MAQTRVRAQAAGLRWAGLEPVADIDESADLIHLPAGRHSANPLSPSTTPKEPA